MRAELTDQRQNQAGGWKLEAGGCIFSLLSLLSFFHLK